MANRKTLQPVAAPQQDRIAQRLVLYRADLAGHIQSFVDRIGQFPAGVESLLAIIGA